MVVLLGVALVMCGALARRYPIAPAILLVLVGVLVGFAPHLRHAQLPPEVVLLLFLPALLYWESLTTSLREIRNNLRVVVLTSTILVFATAAAVASVGASAAPSTQAGPHCKPSACATTATAAAVATTRAVLVRTTTRRLLRISRSEVVRLSQ